MLNLTNAVAERPPSRRWLAAAAGLALGLTAALPARAEDTIKVGILHSLSGTMAISETTLKDVMLMLIDEQNKKGGVLGKKLEAVVVDPASNWPLFAEKARELITQGQGRRRVRLLDLGVAQVGAAGVQGAQQHPVLSGAVRGRGERAQRVLHRRRAEPAGDPGRRLSDEQGRRLGEALGAGRHRLRLSAHHQQDPRGLPEVEGRQRRGHHDQLHAVRLLRLADRSSPRSRSSARPARRRRWSRPSTATPTCRSTRNSATRASRRPTSRSSPSRSAKRNSPASTPSRWSAISPPGTTSKSIKTPANEAFIKKWHAFTKNPKRITNDPMEAHCHRLQHVGEGGREGRHDRPRQGDRRAARHRGAEPDRRHRRRCCRTITSPSRSSSAKSRPTASSTWCGRPRAWSPATPGRTYLPGSKDLDRRLGDAQVRQLQHRDQEVRRRLVTMPAL